MTTSRNFESVGRSQHDAEWKAVMDIPGTMTISLLRVLKRRSLTSSDLSMPSVKAFAPTTKANTIRAMSSALLPFLSSSVLPGYSMPLLMASTGAPGPL